MERLSVMDAKIPKIGFCVYPSPHMSPLVTEPYNAVFCTHSLLEHQNATIIYQNEALYNIARRSLGIVDPTYSTINDLISQSVSSITAGLRFGGGLNNSLNEMITNLVPYPRIHFITPTYSPFVHENKRYYRNPSVHEIT